MNFLEKVRLSTLARVEIRKRFRPIEDFCFQGEEDCLYKQFLKNETCLIAEIKKKSPSLGIINKINVLEMAKIYYEAGISIISLLTEPDFFNGNIADLPVLREKYPDLIILQKDFILDPYQILESKKMGADGILLIVSLLGESELYRLYGMAKEMGLSVIVEIHTLEELKIAKKIGATLIGVNNRNLSTLEVDLNISKKMICYKNLHANSNSKSFFISESGLKSSEEIRELSLLGFNGFLIGSSLMKSKSPFVELSEFLTVTKNTII